VRSSAARRPQHRVAAERNVTMKMRRFGITRRVGEAGVSSHGAERAAVTTSHPRGTRKKPGGDADQDRESASKRLRTTKRAGPDDREHRPAALHGAFDDEGSSDGSSVAPTSFRTDPTRRRRSVRRMVDVTTPFTAASSFWRRCRRQCGPEGPTRVAVHVSGFDTSNAADRVSARC
jgi:hypothetical protein